ncbi:tetratricopeptide repeat protein [Microcoleus sp.]|uniref:tetratricopeptide repeat protein n=1 Tax=Microcoleus sp. TaxID=44472 RepID=UPI0035945645
MKQTSDKLELVEMSAFWIQLFVGGSFLLFGMFAVFFSGGFFAVLFALIGLLLVIFVEIETITFDKNLGHMTINRHKPLMAKIKFIKQLLKRISGMEIEHTKVMKYLLQDISGVEIQEISDSESNKYRICLVLHSGKQRVPLTSGFTTGSLGGYHKEAEVIATFLGIRNYGIDGFPADNSNELKWETVEEEIAHWETAIKSDSNDADAHMKLGLALILQDKTKNKEQAMGYLKQAEALFKAQGYDEEAMEAAKIYGMAYWGMLGK